MHITFLVPTMPIICMNYFFDTSMGVDHSRSSGQMSSKLVTLLLLMLFSKLIHGNSVQNLNASILLGIRNY